MFATVVSIIHTLKFYCIDALFVEVYPSDVILFVVRPQENINTVFQRQLLVIVFIMYIVLLVSVPPFGPPWKCLASQSF